MVDEDTHFPLASELRKRGYDAIHIQEVYRKGEDDVDQLKYAVQEKRCIVSFNKKNFDVLNKEYLQEGHEHWGRVGTQKAP